MKILFYLSRFPGWGGIESVTEIIGSRLAEMGYEISVLAHVRQDRPSALLQKASFHLMPDNPFLRPGESRWDTADNRAFACQLASRERYDIIIYQDSYAPSQGIVSEMAKLCGARLIVFEHSTPLYLQKMISTPPSPLSFLSFIRFYNRRRLDIRRERKRHLFLLQNADKYVVLSKHYIKELQQLCLLRNNSPLLKKVVSINNPTGLKPIPVSHDQKETVILFVGQINLDKGLDTIIHLWSRLYGQYPDWKLQIVGEGPLLETLKNQCRENAVERIEFCGKQQPARYYERAKIFWMTSSFEGWPMTLTEAMGRGCVPVVMNSFSSAQEIIEHNVSGMIVPYGKQDSFLKATSRLMDDDALWQDFSLNALRQAQRFSAENIIPQWIDLIDTLK